MAEGLFSGFGSGGLVEQARLEARRKELERMNKLATAVGGKDPKQRAGAEVGVAFGGAFGKALAEGLGIATDDPEVAAAKKDADLLQQINAITDDPSSASYATKAAQLAHKAGRADLAFQFGQTAGTRAKAEAKLAAATKQQAVENDRAAFNSMTREGKMAIVANDENRLRTLFPEMGDEQIKLVQKEAADTLESIRMKNAAELNKVRPDKPPRDITDNDVDNVIANLATGGYTPGRWGNYTWGGYGDEEHAQLSRMMAQQVEAEVQKATRENVDVGTPTLTNDLMASLVANGGVTVDDDNNILSIDAAKINSTFQQRLAGEATQPTRTLSAQEQQALDWANSNPNDPRAAQIKQKLGL
jgi:hypothetical protein